MGGGGERSSTPGTGWTVGVACAARMRVDGLRWCCLVVVVGVGTNLLGVNEAFIYIRMG